MLEVGAGIKTDKGVLSLLVGLVAEFKAAVKSSTSRKTEFRQKIEQRINILKGYCNILINEIHLKLLAEKRRLLIIVEDMDKADVGKIRDIFFQHSGVISELNARVIFTVHIAHLTTPNIADIRARYQIVRLPMLKVRQRDGVPYTRGVEAIRDIVGRRAESDLFEPDILDRMIDRSGGVLRDLFEMLEVAASSALFQKRERIDATAADYAFQRLKSEYRGMITVWGEKDSGVTTEGLYRKLSEIVASETKEFPLDDAMLLLLSCLAVVEYNGEQWFDAHPAVKSLLETIDMGNKAK